jgi:Flp pilus assembly protein TadG
VSREGVTRRTAGDRGAALLELALVVPFIALLVFGSVEIGRDWVAKNGTASAVAAAARTGATAGSRLEADRDVLVALQAALPAAQLAAADRVVTYDATVSGTVPSACVLPLNSSSQLGSAGCNSYNGTTLRGVTVNSMVGFGGTAGNADSYWPPASRHDTLAGPPSYLGVWVRTRNTGITGFSSFNLTITASAVFRLEPDLSG